MKNLHLIALALFSAQPLLGAVVVYVPPEPVLTLPNASGYTAYDVNFDGTDDFSIGGIQVFGTGLATLQTNRYLAIPAIYPNLGGYPAPLGRGLILGPTALPTLAWLNTDSRDGYVSSDEVGFNKTLLTLCVDSGCTGTFYTDFMRGELNALLGFEFEAADGVHYGYFDLTFTPLSTGGYINGWAYESEAGAPITTAFLTVPEPSSLVMVGSGFFLALARRKRIDV